MVLLLLIGLQVKGQIFEKDSCYKLSDAIRANPLKVTCLDIDIDVDSTYLSGKLGKFENLDLITIESRHGLKHFPKEAFALNHLRGIGVIDNGLGVTDTPLCYPIFNEFKFFKNIESIEIYSSCIDSFPRSFYHFNKLKYLFLQQSTKEVPIPEDINKLQYVEQLEMGFPLSKNVPKEVFEIKSLKDLSLDALSLNDDAKIDFTVLDKLTNLKLKIKKAPDWNKLFVNIDKSKVTLLEIDNKLNKLPEIFYEFPMLSTLYVTIKGTNEITEKIAQIKSLKKLDIICSGKVESSEVARIKKYLPSVDVSIERESDVNGGKKN